MPLIRQDIAQGHDAALALLRRPETEVSDAARVLLRRPDTYASGRFPSHRPDVWIAFDREVRRLASRPYEPLRSNRLEARLCDPDGRIRASALAAWRNPPLLLVLIRCADWAPAVRERARRVLGRIVALDPENTLIALVPLALRLGRREHGAWAVGQLEAALSGRYSLLAAWWRPGRPSTTWSWSSLTAEQRARILDRLRATADLATRRFAARLTVADGRLGVRELARQAASEHDSPACRTWTDAALAAMAADGPDDEAVDTLLRGRIPMVRAAGVTALRRAGRAAEASRHLTDPSGLVRACARWLLRQDGGDPYTHYLGLLVGPEHVSRYAVTGFCECAPRSDAPLLSELLDHPSGVVRAAALTGLRRLDATPDDAALLPLLDDPSASVAREAGLCLRPVARRLDPEGLAARTAPDRPVHTRRAAFHLLRAQGGIAALRAAVALSADPDPGLRRVAADTVQGWSWLHALQERQAERAELGALLAASAHLLPVHRLRWWRARLGLQENDCAELDALLTRSPHDEDRRLWRSRRGLWV
ncbi:hypothetical protein AB0C90_21190 [Streptomyces sp. NPDC048550]|uniref:hypothetical protein n=1 Tax=unclassified Streptomyces TaxID=2593676 RepID=UPI00325465E3|nr:hypothetical protein OG513_09525 [Streptomyces sp. NBC_00998]